LLRRLCVAARSPGKGKGMPLLSRLRLQPSDARAVVYHANQDDTFLEGNLMSKPVFCRIIGLFAALSISVMPVRAQPASDAEGAARELISTMKLEDQFKALLPMILKSLKPAIVQNRADVERDYDALAPILTQGFAVRVSELSDAVAAIYSSNFSAEELRAATAFYRTPAGQKFLLKTPSITQQTMAAGQKFGQSVGADAQKRMIEELRNKGHTL
jgi:uncharacterized protein